MTTEYWDLFPTAPDQKEFSLPGISGECPTEGSAAFLQNRFAG